MNRVFLIQNGLTRESGHFFNETLGWKHHFEENGMSVISLVNRNADQKDVSCLQAHPVFRTTPFHWEAVFGNHSLLASAIEGGLFFADDLGVLEYFGINSNDHLVVPFTSEKEIFGMAHYIGNLNPGLIPRITLVLHRISKAIPVRMGSARGELRSECGIYEYAVNKLIRAFPDLNIFRNNVRFITTNEPLSRLATRLFRVQCLPGCAPLYYPDEESSYDMPERAEDMDLAFIGTGRNEKRPSLAARIIERYAERRPDRQVLFQLNMSSHEKNIGDEYVRLITSLQSKPNIKIIEGSLDLETYHLCLLRSKVLLMPYHPASYRYMISGPFAEGVAKGKVMVVPDGTWMSDMIKSGQAVGRVFQGADIENILEVVESVILGYEHYREQALACVDTWKSQQSLKRLVQLICEHQGYDIH